MDTTSPNVYRPPEQGLFSNTNIIIIVLVILLFLSLTSTVLADLIPAFSDLLSMIGFTTGNLIKGSADVVANTADLGIDIAKGTSHSIGDLFISNSNPGIDVSKQVSLTDIIKFPKFDLQQTDPVPVQSSDPTVTPISTQKPKAGWCYVGDFSDARGCVEVTEHDKCMSGQIFPNQAECLHPPE
jgi:hypothetical protein